MTDQEDKPKIIVDDDWKTRAQEEKEQLQRAAEAKTGTEDSAANPTSASPTSANPTSANPTSDSPAPASETAAQPESTAAESQQAEMPLPPASFPMLVQSLATQTLAMLGQFPMPDGKPVLMLDHAKHHIDTLAVLEEKTKGNLEAGEMVMLNNVLHDLRMAYVEASKQPPGSAAE